MASLAEQLNGKRTGVVLSSAFFGFYAHAGFMSALDSDGVTPTAIGGSSAGALTGAFAASERLQSFIPVLKNLRRKDFWDPGLPGGRPWGLLKGKKLQTMLVDTLGTSTFEGCKIPLLTVSTNLETGRRHVDTRGPIVPAVAASCALPFLFRAVIRDGDRHIDGGIIDKVPIEAMIEHFELDALLVHYIPSKRVSEPAPKGPRKFMDWALDISRDSNWQTQAALAEASGVKVYVISSPNANLGPFSMKRGSEVIEAARTHTLSALQRPSERLRFSRL